MKHINEFFQMDQNLNHLNLSGMNMEHKQLIELCETLSKQPLLMSLHLSDNGIDGGIKASENIYEYLDYFGLSNRNLFEINRSKQQVSKDVVHHRKVQKKRIEIDHHKHLQGYFSMELPAKDVDVPDEAFDDILDTEEEGN